MKLELALRSSAVALLVGASFLLAAPARAGTTIDPVNRYAFGANIGWIDWYADGANGAIVNDYYCSGFIYAANTGWINLGSGAPTNGIRYQNASGADFGVNNDGLGNLRGYAWGANIGWLNFENLGAPRIDLTSGRFSGYVWSANCGWISLSNAFAQVQTDHILQGPLAGNNLPVPWLLQNFGTTAVDPNADPDGDGMSNAQEYWADTNPNDGNDNLQITHVERGLPPHSPTYVILVWTSEPTRLYTLERRAAFDISSPWETSASYDWLGWSNLGFDDDRPECFYRVIARRPLP